MRFSLFKKDKGLRCFTPEVMIATFLVEIVLAIVTFVRYKMSTFARVASLLLVLLAIFQLAEYQICVGAHPLLWARVGFVAITLLPVVGLYLVSMVSRKTQFLKLGYFLAFVYLIYFIFAPNAITEVVCGGNYVIFDTGANTHILYSVYYGIFLLLALWEAIKKIHETAVKSPQRRVLWWVVIGYLSFMVPMMIVYVFFVHINNAIPSIMCGFALIFALILALRIVPRYEEMMARKSKSSKTLKK